MSQESEFISETFHMLAQPVTALRATVELGLNKELDAQVSHDILKDCLFMIDRLMQDVAVFREIASLVDIPLLTAHDGHTLLASCVDEMEIVAETSNVALSLMAEPVVIECNEPSFRRALFVLLDEMIAATAPGGGISISLKHRQDAAVLEVHPGMPHGQRRKLCMKLLQFAGGSDIYMECDRTSVEFRDQSYRQYQSIPFADK